ncbi:MAG: CDP-glucose 4,6-dehydratase [Methylophilaceae bacterium]
MKLANNNNNFWQDKPVFITGHTGFKGAWLSLWLQSLGAKVTGYSLNPPSEVNLFEVAQVGEAMYSIYGDVRDAAHLKKSVLEAKPSVIFHLAAQSLVLQSYQDPVETYSTNVMGTVNVLEAIRQCDTVKSVVVVTSDKCYDNKEWDWAYRENDQMGGYDPYSSSKACTELVVDSYRKAFFSAANQHQQSIAVATVRAGNVIGGGDWAQDRLIPDVIEAFTKQVPVKLRNPSAVRPWQHVLEPLGAYMLLAEKLFNQGMAYAEPWNFGPNAAGTQTTEWLVQRLADYWKSDARALIQHQANEAHEAHCLMLDCTKAHSKLGWQPKWTIERALEHVVDWYQAYRHQEDMHAFSMKQIVQYQACAAGGHQSE